MIFTKLVFSFAAVCIATPIVSKREDKIPLRWATIGDSWASSVAYSDSVTYDGNQDKCLRSKESYTYQMQQDNSWRTGDQELKFPACSGAQLVDMAEKNHQFQVGKTGEPRVLLMTVGGNNAGFADVVVNCIFHPDPGTDYGGPYPSPGLCSASLDKADGILKTTMAEDIRKTYVDIFDHFEDMASDLNVYHTGYVPFFADDSWCQEESFGVWWDSISKSYNQKLNAEVRSAINDLVKKMNGIIEQSVKDYQIVLNGQQKKLARRQKDLSDTGPVIPDDDDVPVPPPPPSPPTVPFEPPIQPVAAKRSIGYIDLSSAFDGHRFCEPGSNHNKQYYGDDTWFWNLNYFSTREAPADGNVPALGPEQLAELQREGILSGSGDGNEVANGWRLRPFHPTAKGNEAIKNTVIQKLRADGVPGVQSVGSTIGGAIAGLLASGGKGA